MNFLQHILHVVDLFVHSFIDEYFGCMMSICILYHQKYSKFSQFLQAKIFFKVSVSV